MKIQLLAEARLAALVLIASGAYSAGNSHGIASKPTAKKKFKRNSITIATTPADLDPFETVPASIAMQQACPVHAKSMSFLRPKRSSNQIGTREEKK